MDAEFLKARAEIDRIDGEMVALFRRRMACSDRIADRKKALTIPVIDTTREEEILQRVAAAAGENCAGDAVKFFQSLLALSRDRQLRRMKAGEGRK